MLLPTSNSKRTERPQTAHGARKHMRGNVVTKLLSMGLIVLSFLMFERLGKVLPEAAPQISAPAIQQRLGLAMLGVFALSALLTYLAFLLFDRDKVSPKPYTTRQRHSFQLMSYATVYSMILGCLSAAYFLWKLPW